MLRLVVKLQEMRNTRREKCRLGWRKSVWMEQERAAKLESFLISVLFHSGSRHIDVCSYFCAHTAAGGRGVIIEKFYISELFFGRCYYTRKTN